MKRTRIAIAALALAASLASAGPALAYNGTSAAAYADQWWNGSNPAYPSFSDDCTDFVSQALRAGGDAYVGQQYANTNDDTKWYVAEQVFAGGSIRWYWSNSWSVSGDLYHFLLNTGRGRLVSIFYPPLTETSGSDGGLPGDVVFYDWGQGLGISHASIQVAYGTDPIYHGTGSLVDQHTSPRYHEIWSLDPTNAYVQTTYAYVVHHN